MKIKALITLLILFWFNQVVLHAQSEEDEWKARIEKLREDKNVELRNRKTSPLKKQDRKQFHDLEYFPINTAWVFKTSFTKETGDEVIDIPTSAGVNKRFQKYGKLSFVLNGKQVTLNAYKRIWPEGSPYANGHQTLFVPFTDLTNGETTYGGGRYLDIEIPEDGSLIMLDFNLCYSPYCAYGSGFSCPIPPAENFINLEVLAGEKAYAGKGH